MPPRRSNKPAARQAPSGTGVPRVVLVVMLVLAGLVLANNTGVIPKAWSDKLVFGTGPRPFAEPEPAPVTAPHPIHHRPPRPAAPVKPAAESVPAAQPDTPVPAVEPPAEATPTPEPAPAPTPAPAPKVQPAPRPKPAPAKITGLLTPDERRARLAGVVLPAGFTSEWHGGPAILRAEANELTRAGTSGQRVALTMDGCFDDKQVPAILEILAAHKVKATFFLTGIFAQRFPASVKRVAAAGHEIGNHSLSHPAFTKLSDREVTAQLDGAERPLLKLAARAYRPYFRPPFGDRNVRVLRRLIQRGYLPVYWTVDTLDWKTDATADSVLAKVTDKGLKPGAILLTHVASPATLAALPRLLELLRQHDLQPGTLSAALKP